MKKLRIREGKAELKVTEEGKVEEAETKSWVPRLLVQCSVH